MSFFCKQNRGNILFTVDIHGQTPLHRAASSGRTGVVKYFCSINTAGEKLLLTKDNDGHTALHYAVNAQIAKLLLETVTSERQKKLLFSVDAH